MTAILVTRAEPGASRTCARLAARGYDPVNAATASVRFLDTAIDLSDGASLALTSPNGAEAAARLIPDRALAVFAVGDATADAARAAGFETVRSAGGDGAALSALIQDHAPSEIVHVRGRDQSFDLIGSLSRAGLTARAVIAYAAEPVARLSDEAAAALQSGAVVLVHSPRGAARFVALAQAVPGFDRVRAVAISEAAAKPLRSAGITAIARAEAPDEDALFAALDRWLR